MSNKVTLVYNLCEKPPENGYSVLYRPLNSTIEYRRWPVNFFDTPAVLNITEDDDGTLYEGFIRSEYADGRACTPVAWRISENFVWVEDTYVCAQDNPFAEVGSVTGMSSPYTIMYDSTSGLVYGVDADNVSGCFFHYNPVGFNNPSQVTYIQATTGAGQWMYAVGVDKQNRRLYAAGLNSGGLQVYDIATGTVSVKPYGSDSSFSRVLLLVLGTTILCNDINTGQMIVFDRASLSLLSTKAITSITDGIKCMIGSPAIAQVGNQFWVLQSQKPQSQAPSQSGNLFIYDLTFNNKLYEVDLSGMVSQWAYDGGNLSYFRTIYYDSVRNKVYIFDAGTNKLIKVDPVTRVATVVKTITNKTGYTNSFFHFVIDPITGTPFLTGTVQNTLSGANISITYEWDFDTDQVTNIYPGLYMQDMIQIGATSTLHSNYFGFTVWSGNSAWNTDGGIKILTR